MTNGFIFIHRSLGKWQKEIKKPREETGKERMFIVHIMKKTDVPAWNKAVNLIET